MIFRLQRFGARDFHVKTFRWLTKGSGKDWMGNGVDSLTDLQSWLNQNSHSGSYLKTYLDCLIAMVDKISNMSSRHWMTSGISWRGEYWTQNTLERPKDAVGCTLS